ncbi:MAG: porin family protein [Alphaproteobacteria bacterium]|nr:porin family protein [Alphaproteobacteria bacterium]
MKKLILFATVSFISVSAVAGPRGYIAPRVGLSDVRETAVKDHHEAEFAPGVALGLAHGPLRGEVEYTHITEADIEKDGDFDVLNAKFNRVMVNGYVDLQLSYHVRPYIMAGVGVAHHNVSYKEEDFSGSNFAWNAGAGVGFHLNRNLALDIGMKYVDLGEVELENQEKDFSFDTVETYAGLRFIF